MELGAPLGSNPYLRYGTTPWRGAGSLSTLPTRLVRGTLGLRGRASPEEAGRRSAAMSWPRRVTGQVAEIATEENGSGIADMHGVIGNAAAVGRNATSFRLSIESEPGIENASWHHIAGALERIEAGHRSFVVLIVNDQNFVQTLGNRDALVVEWRTTSEDMMSHYVLGRKGSVKSELQCVPGSAGNSEVVLHREVLDLTDALIIFQSFYEHQKVPDAFHLRDITKRNAARAVAHLSPFGLVLLWQGWHSPDPQAAEVLERYLDREYPSWRELLAFEGPLTREYALALLGLCENASADDVRRAYRERMLLYHPDNGGSSALAVRFNEAAAILRK